jgi:predicted integral membrane protein DUF2275/putative zinc finger protein
MDHNDIRHKLSEYIDGSVTAEEKSSIEEHLKTCSACGDALRELQKTVEHIKSVEEVEPPAWMTQKIMANVRAEAEERNGLFRRLFYPLSVKLPIQAVAVLFLAVTAFYIYRNIQPVPSEAPMQEHAATKDVPQAAAPSREQTIPPEQPGRSKKAPQSPEYKSLDMKYEYEKPAPPVPMDKIGESGPAPAKPAQQPLLAQQEESAEKRTVAPRAEAPAARQDQASGKALRQEAKLKSDAGGQRALKAMSLDRTGPVISVMVKDIDDAAGEVERLITKLGGSITLKEDHETKKAFRIAIDVQKLKEFRDKLKLIGEVKDDTVAPGPQDKRIELKIEIKASSAQP